MLECYPIDTSQSTAIPFPNKNAGLYTGEAAILNAPWGPVLVRPEAGQLLTDTIKSANPPPNAVYTYGTLRPGNNNLLPVQNRSQFCGMNCMN